jgi:DNA-binding transcriptional LysR family regulator
MDALQAVMAAQTMGSFSAAATALNITHGAVSRRVATVEHWAGYRLFERHGRGVRLTLQGQMLADRIEQTLVMLDDARALPRSIELDVVRVGVLPSFARLWLLPNLAALEGTPPDLRIEPDIDFRLMTLSDARIAIRYGRGDWSGVSAIPLFDEALVPVAAPRIFAALGPDATATALLRHPLVHDFYDAHWRTWLAACGVEYERRPQDRIITDYDVTLLTAAQGHGVALLREPYGNAVCRQLGLRPVSSLRAPNALKFFVVTKPGPRHAAIERLVQRFLALAGAAA